MQPNLIAKGCVSLPAALNSIRSPIGHTTQVRNHVKCYPWRFNRSNAECYLDNTRTPYTDKYNINEFKSSKKAKKSWMEVIPKDKDNRFNRYKWHEGYTSDPKEAKQIAQSRLQSLQDSLTARGHPRESKPYNPPENVEQMVIGIFEEILRDSDTLKDRPQDISDINLNSTRSLKFELLSRCVDEFQHDMPSSHLNDMQSISDVITYFSTPIRGTNPYNALLNNNSLPTNLSLIAEPMRYDRDNDETFGGHSALPGVISKVPGLRASKKYAVLNQDEFQWPDI